MLDNPDRRDYGCVDELRPEPERQQFDFRTPLFSSSFKGTSTQVLSVILVGACVGLLAYMMAQNEANSKERHTELVKKQDKTHGAVRALTYITYVCTNKQKQKECESINLGKPKELRDMELE